MINNDDTKRRNSKERNEINLTTAKSLPKYKIKIPDMLSIKDIEKRRNVRSEVKFFVNKIDEMD
jgi:hypothetical protein